MASATTAPAFSAEAHDHFIFEDHHHALRETIRRFVDAEIVPHVDEWEEKPFPNNIFRRLGDLGLLGLAVPEDYGGQGGDYVSRLVLSEELNRGGSAGLALSVAVQTDMVIPPLLAFGSEAQKQSWLVPGVRGEKIFCLGITEPDAGSDVANVRTSAKRHGDEFVINGAKTYITNGHRADAILLVTKTDPEAGRNGITLFFVPMDAPGIIREKRLRKLGNHASDTAQLAFRDVRVPADMMLGEEGRGFHNLMWQLQGERLIGACTCVAGAQYCFDRTLQFARDREAFGQSISEFQVIRHKFAEMAVKIETARQMVYSTAWRYARGAYPVRDISIAKLNAARMACEVADTCIQIHGGAGYMQEYGVERMWRDMRVHRIGGGTDEILLDIIAGSLLGRARGVVQRSADRP